MRTPKITKPIKLTLLLAFVFTMFSCSEDDSQPYITTPPSKGRVLVVGAGASGLQAAKMLKDNGYDVDIMEASAEIGGRLRKNTTLADFDLDLGAEWGTGTNSYLYEMTQIYGQDIVIDNTEEQYWFIDEVYDVEDLDCPEHIKALVEYVYETAHTQPNQTIDEWAEGEGMGSEYDDLIEAIANLEGASAENLSAPEELLEELKSNVNRDKFRLRNKTYCDFVHDHLADALKDEIYLSCPVSKIDYSGELIKVTVGEKIYEVDKVIVTVSVKVLQEGYIEFVPALPAEKLEAINNIGMEEGMKVFLKFTDNFFQDAMIVGGSEGSMYYDATHGKDSEDAILGVQVTGRNARELSALPEAQAVQAILSEMDEISEGLASQKFTGEYKMVDWGKEEFIKGAFSYEKVNTGDARDVLAAPVAKKIYFAGEATSTNGNKGTVNGALETGKREALRVMEDFE
ncbi:flavin monoamine oxidase family protein [Aureivirga marina]|uniref:flavin monoamine oxidase family protein n=1 Tax=Aureivirga marina TaxID=1182451 RepID=UPI0018CBD785|nr:NAD(P)/FAD-dependent oxidoreductase [Aureivirga marina]